MIRALLWILGAILLGGIVHLTTVLVMPRAATQDAYARLLPLTPVNTMVQLAAPTPEKSIMPLMDPAFAAAVCRYDLSAGAIKLNAPLSQAYTSVTFYTRNSVAYYAIDDRAAGRRAIGISPGSGANARSTISPVLVGDSMISRSAAVTSSPSGTCACCSGVIRSSSMARRPAARSSIA